MSECKLKIGITQGDPNGIGWEGILKMIARVLGIGVALMTST